jgi:type I restriction enzyme S subunit
MSFPAYPAYRDSGVEWLGAIPEHWGVKQLRYLGRFRKGLTITKADLADTGIPCLNYGEVHSLYPFEVNQDIQPLKSVPVEYLDTDPSACVKYGDFVFADTSEDLDGVGNFTLVSGMGSLFSGYHTIIYSPDSEVSSRFLAYCLDSFAFRTQLRMGVKGVKVFSVTQEILRGGTAWLPTTAEQTQIARFLDHETARIDALIEEQQRLIELLKEKRQAVISHAVTKGLDPTVPMKDSGIEWLGEVPAHWDVKKLKNVTRQIIDGAHFTPTYVDVGVPFIRVTDIQNPELDLDGVKRIPESEHRELVKRCNPARGDVLLSKNGTIGVTKVVDWDFEFSIFVSLCLLKPAENISSKYLLNFLSGSCAQEQFNDSGQKTSVTNLHLEKIREISIALPDGAEQLRISSFIDEKTSELDLLISEARLGNSLLQERRSALISAAVTGKIDVRDWQPPASTQAPKLEVAEAH